MSPPANWLRHGTEHALQVLIFEPLFEEANRTRRLIVEMMRALDRHGIGSCLPDLPGTGESQITIAEVAFADWLDAANGAVVSAKPAAIASLRGGALIDAAPAPCHWRFAPETGARIVRDLKRAQLAGHNHLFGGHHLNADFVAALGSALPSAVAPLRTIRLDTDAADADAKVAGSPLWRRAEPGEDGELAKALAADLATWVKQCAAS